MTTTTNEKALGACNSGGLSLKASKKLIGMSLTVRSGQVNGLRKKLNDVLEKLNELQVADSEGGK